VEVCLGSKAVCDVGEGGEGEMGKDVKLAADSPELLGYVARCLPFLAYIECDEDQDEDEDEDEDENEDKDDDDDKEEVVR